MIAVATRKGVTLYRNPVNDTVEGGGTEGGADTGQEGGGAETTEGGAAADTVQAGEGNDTVDAGAGEEQLSEREQAMELIARRNSSQIDKEHAEAGHKPPGGTPAPTPAAPAAPAQPDQTELQTGDETVLDEAALAKIKVRVKVDGVEEEITGLEMKRRAQKSAAADKRLEEASQLLRDVHALHKATPATTPATPAPPVGGDGKGGTGNSPAAPATDASLDATGKEFLTALFEGDETKAMEALKKVLGGRAGESEGSTPTEADLIAKITPAVKQQLAVESALDGFAKKHGDIVKDPVLASLADGFLAEVQKTDPDLAFDAALEKSAERVRGWLADKGVKPPAPSPSPGPTASRTEKLEAKRQADQVAGASTRASAPVPQVQTPSDVIAEMRKSRGMDA